MADLIETAQKTQSLETLMGALQKAGLVDTLKSPGPFTILAPTDEAFAKLPADALDSVMEDAQKLKKILTYHVLFGDVREEDLQQIDEAPTVEGSIVAVEHENGVNVNEAKVVQTDILADNGVIHIIDSVLMPAIMSGT